MNLKTKLATGLLTAGILASSFAPAAFAANVRVRDNGALSQNHVTVKNKKVTKVNQYNGTAVVNLVGVGQNTGGNKANFNTGGNTTVNSGVATATVTNTTTTGGNDATVTGCCCGDETAHDIAIVDNGALSHNDVYVSDKCVTKANQTNETLVVNGVLVGQNTGHNSASFNTGGTVDVGSGDASATVTNTTTTGGNTLVISN